MHLARASMQRVQAMQVRVHAQFLCGGVFSSAVRRRTDANKQIDVDMFKLTDSSSGNWPQRLKLKSRLLS